MSTVLLGLRFDKLVLSRVHKTTYYVNQIVDLCVCVCVFEYTCVCDMFVAVPNYVYTTIKFSFFQVW